ncbi:MAG: DUF2909 domain-containing protein [Rubrivivax sp.]|jgi:hypothetical protein|nr:DUF2909 domain-containing protein [Rubrivivax sp.]
MKLVIVLLLGLIVAALASAGVFMLRERPGGRGDRDRQMARALAVRVGLSVAVFLLVLLAWMLGWITPSGLPVGG